MPTSTRARQALETVFWDVVLHDSGLLAAEFADITAACGLRQSRTGPPPCLVAAARDARRPRGTCPTDSTPAAIHPVARSAAGVRGRPERGPPRHRASRAAIPAADAPANPTCSIGR